MSDSDHLSGDALEALAAGEAGNFTASQHLEHCAACRAALESMRHENTLFAAELAAPNLQEQTMNAGISVATAGAKVTKPAHESHRPFVFYAAAASVMLVAALALIHYGQGQQPVKIATPEEPPRAVAEQGKVPPEKVGDDKDKDKETITEDKPPEGEAVFEGMTAAQWEAQLRKDAAGATYNPSGSKSVHALSVLGREALPQIVSLTRSQDDNCRSAAASIIQNIPWDKNDLPRLFEMLKNDDYATRKTGVQILSVLTSNPDLVASVRPALQPLLKDRDKAVVEIAQKTVSEIDERAAAQERGREAAANHALSLATKMLESNDLEFALKYAHAAEAYKPDDPRVKDVLSMIEYRKRKLEAGVKTDPVAPIDLPPGAGVSAIDVENPKNLDGKVLAYKAENNQVMLSVGSQQGVQPGYSFTISRGPNRVGTVTVDKVYPDMSSAKITTAVAEQTIQVNDSIALGNANQMRPVVSGVAASDADAKNLAAENEAAQILAKAQSLADAKVYPVAHALLTVKILEDARLQKTPAAARARVLAAQIQDKMAAESKSAPLPKIPEGPGAEKAPGAEKNKGDF